MSSDQIENIFGNKTRIRVMGLLSKDSKLLVLNHRGLTRSNIFWSPPGGGVEFGHTLVQSLKNEFLQEVHLDVEVGGFLFGFEFIQDSLHAIELFFKIDAFSGQMEVGSDPETGENQIIQEAQWLTLEEIKKAGKGTYHEVFDKVKTIEQLLDKGAGFYLLNIR